MAPKRNKRKQKSSAAQRDGKSADAALRDAVSRHQAGDLVGAERAYRKVLRRDDSNGEVWHQLGAIQYQLGNVAAAANSIANAAERLPDSAVVRSDLGGLLLAQSDFSGAEKIFREALVLEPDNPGLHYNLSIALHALGRKQAARSCLQTLVAAQPGFFEAHFNLGIVLRELDELRESMLAFEKARSIQPNNPDVLRELGRTYRDLSLPDRAAKAFVAALESRPDISLVPEAAESLWIVGDADAAIAISEKYLIDDPNNEALLISLGRIHHNQGAIDVAESCLRRAVASNPDSVGALIGLSRIKTFRDRNDPVVQLLERALEARSNDPVAETATHFALAKIWDDLKDYPRAWEALQRGNERKAVSTRYDRERATKSCEEGIEKFDHPEIERLQHFGSSSEVPVFIVGMPRTGTTLVEQIVSSHPDAAGAGELIFIPSLTANLPALTNGTPYPGCVSEIDSSLAQTIDKNYHELLRRHGADAQRVTDKLPGNYLYLGLIKGLFPRASIIHCQRHPLDVVLSIYFQYFGDGVDYAWKLGDIAHHYLIYDRLMAHWRSIFKNDILNVAYETLVNDFEASARQIIGHCGLSWNDACLDFHLNEREVRTASNWQVRQPLYKNSVARHSPYREFLVEAANELHELIDDYENRLS